MPIVPPAPGRFSTITGWPSCAVSFSATVRAMMSVALPGVKGTVTRIGLAGQGCAHAAALEASSAAGISLAAAIQIPVRLIEPSLLVYDRKVKSAPFEYTRAGS